MGTEYINKQLQQLAKRWTLTNLETEQEPYILTKDEEYRLFENEKESISKHLAWKMSQLLFLPDQIEAKLKEINWDERIDKEELFQRANSIKNHELWQKQQRVKEKEEEEKKIKELKDTWTAKKMYQLMAWASQNNFKKKLIVNEDNKKFITALCFFISRDVRFETELGYSLNKGMLIRGISGLGKTHLVRCLESNELNPILILSMIEISETIKEDGEFQIVMGKNKIMYLDDVGTEQPIVNHYGTKINFFKNFIEGYYLRNNAFNNLIVSTNNSFSELEEKYGFRVRSRMKDMFNIIDVTGKDMRG